MKKSKLLLLMLCLVLCFTCVFAACEEKQPEETAHIHSYNKATYEWTKDGENWICTATRVCALDATHVETEQAVATCVIDPTATCDGIGVATYTATFNNQYFAKQSKVETLGALMHQWGPWTHVEGSETHQRVCANDPSHVQIGNCEYIGGVCIDCGAAQPEPIHVHNYTPVAEVPATCTKAGTKAHFICQCGLTFVEQEGQKVEVSANELIIPVDANAHVYGAATYAVGTDGNYDKIEVCGECAHKQETVVAYSATNALAMNNGSVGSIYGVVAGFLTENGTSTDYQYSAGMYITDGATTIAFELTTSKGAKTVGNISNVHGTQGLTFGDKAVKVGDAVMLTGMTKAAANDGFKFTAGSSTEGSVLEIAPEFAYNPAIEQKLTNDTEFVNYVANLSGNSGSRNYKLIKIEASMTNVLHIKGQDLSVELYFETEKTVTKANDTPKPMLVAKTLLNAYGMSELAVASGETKTFIGSLYFALNYCSSSSGNATMFVSPTAYGLNLTEVTYVAEVPACCEQAGVKAHYELDGKVYTIGGVETTMEALAIPTTGSHNWSADTAVLEGGNLYNSHKCTTCEKEEKVLVAYSVSNAMALGEGEVAGVYGTVAGFVDTSLTGSLYKYATGVIITDGAETIVAQLTPANSNNAHATTLGNVSNAYGNRGVQFGDTDLAVGDTIQITGMAKSGHAFIVGVGSQGSVISVEGVTPATDVKQPFVMSIGSEGELAAFVATLHDGTASRDYVLIKLSASVSDPIMMMYDRSYSQLMWYSASESKTYNVTGEGDYASKGQIACEIRMGSTNLPAAIVADDGEAHAFVGEMYVMLTYVSNNEGYVAFTPVSISGNFSERYYVEAVEATCTSKGCEAYYILDGKVYNTSFEETIVEELILPTTAHQCDASGICEICHVVPSTLTSNIDSNKLYTTITNEFTVSIVANGNAGTAVKGKITSDPSKLEKVEMLYGTKWIALENNLTEAVALADDTFTFRIIYKSGSVGSKLGDEAAIIYSLELVDAEDTSIVYAMQMGTVDVIEYIPASVESTIETATAGLIAGQTAEFNVNGKANSEEHAEFVKTVLTIDGTKALVEWLDGEEWKALSSGQFGYVIDLVDFSSKLRIRALEAGQVSYKIEVVAMIDGKVYASCEGTIEFVPVQPAAIEVQYVENTCYDDADFAGKVQYRAINNDGSYGDWTDTTSANFSDYQNNNGVRSATVSATFENGTFTCTASINIITVTAVEVSAQPEQTRYTSTGVAYNAMNLDGAKLTVTRSNDTTEIIDVTVDMLGDNTLAYGSNTVAVTYRGATTDSEHSIVVEVKALSVSEFKQVEDGTTCQVEALVVGPMSSRNAIELLIKDVETNEFIGIYNSGVAGSTSAPALTGGLAVGDRVVFTVVATQVGSADSNYSNANKFYANAASNFASSMIILDHDHSVKVNPAECSTITITSEQELRDFCLGKSGHYQIIKLVGVRGIYYSGNLRIFFGNDVTKYAEQQIHYIDTDYCSPILDAQTNNYYLGANWIADFFLNPTSTSYAEPCDTLYDVYVMYNGGNVYYENFVVIDSDWFVLHNCEADGHYVRTIEYYTGTADAMQAWGTCAFCGAHDCKAGAEFAVEKGELIPAVAVTCTTDGMNAYYYNADYKFFFDADGNYTTQQALVIPQLGHDFTAWAKVEGTDVHKHVCQNAGCGLVEFGDCTYEADVCTVCGGAKPTTPHVHVYDQEIISAACLASEANCSALATYYKSCVCGAFEANPENTFSAGNYGNHVIGELIPAGTSTCCEHGLAAHYQCAVCGQLYSEDKTPVSEQDLWLDLAAHNYTKYSWVKVTDASQLADGDRIIFSAAASVTSSGSAMKATRSSGSAPTVSATLNSLDPSATSVDILKLEKVGNYWGIRSYGNGSTYPYISTYSSAEYKLSNSASTQYTNSHWTISFDGSGASYPGWARIKNRDSSATYGYLCYNKYTASTTYSYGLRKSAGGYVFYIYKLVLGDWTDTGAEAKPTVSGYYTCKTCGAHIDKAGKATCVEHHYAYGTCTVCGATHEGHTFGTNHVCSVCGYVHESANHVYNAEHVCTVCGYNYGSTDHVWEKGICSICGTAHEGHTFDTNHVCTVCGYEGDPTHTWENGTCTICGTAHTGHTFDDQHICTVCGHVYDCGVDGHLVTEFTTYTEISGLWYGVGTCTVCQAANVANGTAESPKTTTDCKTAGTTDNPIPVEMITGVIVGFGGLNGLASGTISYVFITDGTKVLQVSGLGDSVNATVSDYVAKVGDHELKLGDTLLITDIGRAGNNYLKCTAQTKFYVGETFDVNQEGWFNPTASYTFTMGNENWGTYVIGGVQKITATEEHPLYIAGYNYQDQTTTAKNYLVVFGEKVPNFGPDLLAATDLAKTRYKYGTAGNTCYVGGGVAFMELNGNGQWLVDSFGKTFSYNEQGELTGLLNSKVTPIGTYAFKGTFYMVSMYRGTANGTYLTNYILGVGNTLEPIYNKGELVAESTSTCTENGLMAHYYDAVHDQYFNAEGQPVELKDIQLPLAPHVYGADHVCTVCSTPHETTAHTYGTDHVCTICGTVHEQASHTFSAEHICSICGFTHETTTHVYGTDHHCSICDYPCEQMSHVYSAGICTICGAVNYGTADEPLTVADVNNIVTVLGLKNGEFTQGQAYIKGTITEIKGSYAVSGTDYRDANVVIKDASDNTLAVSYLLYSNTVSFIVGDEIVLYGYIEYYNGASIYPLSKTWATGNTCGWPELVKVSGNRTVGVTAEHATVKNALTQADLNNTQVMLGATVMFTVEVEEGYELVNVKVNNEEVEPISGNVYSAVANGDISIAVSTKESGAKDPVLLATFNLGTNGDAGHSDGSVASSYSETFGNYTLTLSGLTNVYSGAKDALGNACLKLGTGSKTASFSFTVGESVTKVIIYIGGYKTNYVAKFTVNGGAEMATTKQSDNGEYDAIEVNTSTNKTVTIATTSNGYRAMVNAIAFYGDEEQVTPPTPTCEHTSATRTADEAGVKPYWYCSDCQTYFKDNEGAIGETIGDATAFATWKEGEGKVQETPPTNEKTYVKVTDVSNLREGDVIVLGCAAQSAIAGPMGTGTFLSKVNMEISDGQFSAEEAFEITLGGIADAWTLTTSEGQITASKAKAFVLDNGTQKTCTISISGGVATITFGSYGSIQYNSGSPRFLNYTSSQTGIEIYKLVTAD